MFARFYVVPVIVSFFWAIPNVPLALHLLYIRCVGVEFGTVYILMFGGVFETAIEIVNVNLIKLTPSCAVL